MFTYHFVAFDFEIEYAYRPNDDIYQEILPKELKLSVSVPINFKELLFDEQKALLKDAVKEELTQVVLFDTPDEPDFAIDDVDFCFEDAD